VTFTEFVFADDVFFLFLLQITMFAALRSLFRYIWH